MPTHTLLKKNIKYQSSIMYSTYTSLFGLAMLANTALAQSTFQVNSGATLYLNGATLTLTDTKLTNKIR